MNCFEMDQAQQRFPELVERARRGEDIIITERNQPVVKFVVVEQDATAPAVPTKRRRRPGSAKSKRNEKDRYPLRGTAIKYLDPTEPVADADWSVSE